MMIVWLVWDLVCAAYEELTKRTKAAVTEKENHYDDL